jgi:hypothetical protein
MSSILESCHCLADLHSLSSSCKCFRNIFIANGPGYDCQTIFRRRLSAFDDALRAQRASVATIRHLIHLGYNSDDLESMMPPSKTALATPVISRFDLDKG